MRQLLRLAISFRHVSRRIHSPRFWRGFYQLLASPASVERATRAAVALRRRRGDDALAAALAQLGELFVWSGWPHQSRGWINLDASRFLARVHAGSDPSRTNALKRRPREQSHPLRVGCVGAFSALLTLSREHFEQTPDELELSVFDLEYQGRTAAYLAPFVASYMAFPRDPQRFAAMADAVNAADLDVLYVVAHGGEALRLVDQAETACIVNACTGSDLLHHPKVDVQLYPQPQADYFARDGRVFCGTSRSCFGPERVAPAFFLYDGRGLDPARRAPWREREPLILFHGTLYKAVSPVYLDAIFGLLERDPELQFVLMGRDQGGQREAIERSARNRGLQQRVRYEGAFSGLRGPDGAIDDPAWSTLEDLLRRARLAPDPWPMGGAAARVEAYGAGVPSAHLRVRFEPEAWGRPQDALVEVEALLVPEGSAWTVHEYSELCDRCLHDEAFADSLAAEQARVFRQVTDAPAYWRQLVGAYDDWRG